MDNLQQRFDSYRQGGTQEEMGARVGMTGPTFGNWMRRRGLRAHKKRTIPIILAEIREQKRQDELQKSRKFVASRPEWERLAVRHFVTSLIKTSEQAKLIDPDSAIDFYRFVNTYRDIYGHRLTIDEDRNYYGGCSNVANMDANFGG